MSTRLAVIAILLASIASQSVRGQECTDTFADALSGGFGGGIFSDTGLFKTALDLSGYKDKLPPASLGITLIIPTNQAWLKLLWDSGFFITSLSKIDDQLPATVLYNVIPQALSPDSIRAQQGESQTAYGLLGGGNYPLKYWSDAPEGDKPGSIRFQGTMRTPTAKTTKDPIKVCNSWIYVVDEVLFPADKIKNVQPVEIPESLPWDSNPAPQVVAPTDPLAVAPVMVPAPVVAPVQQPTAPLCSITPTTSVMVDSIPAATVGGAPTCATNFADAARSSSLNILSTLLSSPGTAKLLPDPATPNTLLAPTDAAFFTMLSKLNLSLASAQTSLGDILGSVLLYHIVPGYALTEEDIRSRAGLSTALGTYLNDPDYFVGVQANTDGSTTLTGLYPDNIAKITGSQKICETTVYLIDSVLIPGPSLDVVPKTSTVNVPVATPVAPAPTESYTIIPGVTDANGVPTGAQAPVVAPTVTEPVSNGTTGSANVVGGLANCLVKLELPGGVLTAITDNTGQFSFPELVGCVLQQAVAWIPTGVEQLESCVDSVTEMPPPFTLTSFLDVLADGGNADSLMFTLSPLVSLLTRELEPTDTNLLAAPWMSQLAGIFNVSGALPLLGGNYFQGANLGNLDDMSVLSANSNTVITTALGSTALSNLIPEVNVEDAASALLKILGQAARNNINMQDAASIQGLLTTALQSLMQQVANENPAPMTQPAATAVTMPTVATTTTEPLQQGVQSRKMLQDGPQVVDLGATTAQLQPVVDPMAPVAVDFNTQVLTSLAQPIAFLNGLADQACQAAKTNPAAGAEATTTVQRVTQLAQASLTQAVADLSKGVLSPSEFDQQFSPPNLSLKVYPVPAAAPVVAAQGPAPVKGPAPSQSAPVSMVEVPTVAPVATSAAVGGVNVMWTVVAGVGAALVMAV